MQNNGNRRRTLLPISFESKRQQQLVVLAEVAHGQVDTQGGQRVAIIHSQDTARLDIRLWGLQRDALNLEPSRCFPSNALAPAQSREYPRARPCDERPSAQISDVPSATTVSAMILRRASPFHLDRAAHRGIEAEIAIVFRGGHIHDGAQWNFIDGRDQIGMRPLYWRQRNLARNRRLCANRLCRCIRGGHRGLRRRRSRRGICRNLAQPVRDAQFARLRFLRPGGSP